MTAGGNGTNYFVETFKTNALLSGSSVATNESKVLVGPLITPAHCPTLDHAPIQNDPGVPASNLTGLGIDTEATLAALSNVASGALAGALAGESAGALAG